MCTRYVSVLRVLLKPAADLVLQKFEFTPEGIAKRAKLTIDFYKDAKLRSPVNRAFQQLI